MKAMILKLIEHELRTRGTTIEAWAARHGLTPSRLADIFVENNHPEILLDLQETTGISPTQFDSYQPAA